MLESMRIVGGKPLIGTIKISGSKNMALPALAAGLLTEEPITLTNVPELADIKSMMELLSYIGADISQIDKNTVSICTKNVKFLEAPYDFVRKMRASILVLGALIGRFGSASVSLPGGCAIGTRGVDLHIKALEELGATISLENGYIHAQAPRDGLIGTDINFPIVTITGVENVMMAACYAKGTTRLINSPIEPEVVAFADLLNKMGADITGHGTHIITINGVEKLHGTEFLIIPDRIEAGTYAVAAAATHGEIFLENCNYDHLSGFFSLLQKTGTCCKKKDNGVLVGKAKSQETIIHSLEVETAPYPGLATDLQAQLMVLITRCNGVSSITENIFENRFMHVPELVRMGADISIHGKTAILKGVPKLGGAHVMATDLRASVSLVIAGLIAEGETVVNRLYHLNRGYEDIDEKLRKCGAILERFCV
ncbi:MAG: UDP-N-acetylglucosamine 1-carboxyvinyltransferase [Holosporales bacterium]|jgi:UDP-N-acetylglucosamine 1-carboxyvinyltransferase|nr:UDP-N-acetylglucosamine 1-carboxyvinyltransferase [Holosporales bacterium]